MGSIRHTVLAHLTCVSLPPSMFVINQSFYGLPCLKPGCPQYSVPLIVISVQHRIVSTLFLYVLQSHPKTIGFYLISETVIGGMIVSVVRSAVYHVPLTAIGGAWQVSALAAQLDCSIMHCRLPIHRRWYTCLATCDRKVCGFF